MPPSGVTSPGRSGTEQKIISFLLSMINHEKNEKQNDEMQQAFARRGYRVGLPMQADAPMDVPLQPVGAPLGIAIHPISQY